MPLPVNPILIKDGVETHCPQCSTKLFIKNDKETLFVNTLFVHWVRPDVMDIRCKKCKRDIKIS